MATQKGGRGLCVHLVEVYVVVERHDLAERSGPEPRQRVPAHWEQYERHVELEGLCGAFGDADAVAHHLKHCTPPVLNELEYEEGNVEDTPQREHPYPLPVLVDEVDGLVNAPLQWAPVAGGYHRPRQTCRRHVHLVRRP